MIPYLPNKIKLEDWLMDAAPGDRVVYHVGPYASGPVCVTARKLHSRELILMFIRRRFKHDFEYIAQKITPPARQNKTPEKSVPMPPHIADRIAESTLVAAQIAKLREEGLSVGEIAKRIDRTTTTVRRYLREEMSYVDGRRAR